MKRVPPTRPAYVNLRGEPIDPLHPGKPAHQPLPPGRKPPQALHVATPVVLVAADIDRVWDALALAGCLRSKTWLLQFLRLLEWRSARDAWFTLAEVQAALAQLLSAGRILELPGRGYDIAPAARTEALPRLLSADGADQAWKAWTRASAPPYALSATDLPVPHFSQAQDATGYARLMLYGGVELPVWRRVSQRIVDHDYSISTVAEALAQPFMPALFERNSTALQAAVLQDLARVLPPQRPVWSTLMPWIEAWLARAPYELSLELRFLVADRHLNAGRADACRHALAGINDPNVGLFEAALLAQQGQWAAAATLFASSHKTLSKALKARRAFAPYRLLQWQVWAWLAQPDPAGWTAAQKFAVLESGSRNPAPDAGWGLFAHAIAVRLGDARLQPEVLAWPRTIYPQKDHDGNANRLILAAWLGHRPEDWTAGCARAVVQGLLSDGLSWKADLVRQACERLDLAPPPRGTDEGPPWQARFFAARTEAWRDALAAIEALGQSTSAAGKAAAPVSALQWRLQLDAAGRVSTPKPFERVVGVRGPGKAKPVPLSRLKRSTRLDPHDAAVARCISNDRWSATTLVLDAVSATIALVGHPNLVFADAPDQVVDLREAVPMLELRRQRAADGSECFAFHLPDPVLSSADDVADDDDDDEDDDDDDDAVYSSPAEYLAHRERRNNLRVVRDGPDRARLLRITPAQRRVAELVSQGWTVPVSAQAELDAALRVLAGHFQLHSDAAGGQEVPSVPLLRAQLSPLGDALQLRLVVQPFGDFGPAVVPGRGRERLLTVHQGLSLATQRQLPTEAAHLDAVLAALPFLAAAEPADAVWLLADPEQALTTLEQLPQLPGVAAIEWPRGKPVRVLPAAAAALQVKVGSGVDWFSVDGELRLDEQRVIGLQRLMTLVAEAKRSRFVALGNGEYLALTEQLRQQLADLQALAQPGTAGQTGLRLPATGAAWLADALDGAQVKGDRRWAERLRRLDEAATLEPRLPAALQADLRSYQIDGYVWLARLAHAGLGACLADDMGLGKTLQTLALLLDRAASGPALVLAPTSVCANWVAEAARFAPSLGVITYGDGDRDAALAAAGPGQLVVASYALAQIDIERFVAIEWATLVLDEAQAVKNATTKRARSVASLNAGFRLALTGTPVENRLVDLWSVMNILNPGLLGSQARFSERFSGPIERDRDEAARHRLRRLVAPFLLRRTKAQVLTDLPPRTEIVHRIEPGPDERAFLEAARRQAIDRVAQAGNAGGPGQAAFHVLAELTRLRRAACDPRLVAPETGLVGAKLQEFEQLATELVAGRHKALVFSQFTDFLKLLAERLTQVGISHQYLDGGTPAATRSQRVAAFQRGEGDLFLISLKAGGFGLNLTAADYVIIVDPWWNPAAEDQAMGRAHRIGQLRPVTVYRLVTAGSIEERIVALHRDKRSLADGILDAQDQAAPIDAQALRELLQER